MCVGGGGWVQISTRSDGVSPGASEEMTHREQACRNMTQRCYSISPASRCRKRLGSCDARYDSSRPNGRA